MRAPSAVLLALFLGTLPAGTLEALAPRVVFERRLPAAQDLGGARDIAIVEAASTDPHVEAFVEHLLHHVNRSGVLSMRDLRIGTGPADAHINIETFRCEQAVTETEGTVPDVDGKRVRQKLYQINAVCGARIAVLSRFLKPVATYFAKGEGVSRRLESITDEERQNAFADAARYAAVNAAERITPRRVRESIALDDRAPAFAEGMALIEAGRLAETRALWQKAMQTQPRSAPLRFNLGAVCEALGDRGAAETHYNAAKQLAPSEERYANEIRLFVRRK